MSHDLVIRNGLVVDGTGAPPVIADVSVDGDRIVEVSPAGGTPGPARATREIDAEGRLVTPGFVDIHTHLDAQIGWDPLTTSSCWHGVTSIVMGNCGVTFAPCRPEDRSYLAEMMESVEDIPADAIRDGLSWNWETYGDYLDELERLPKGLNVGGMVGHCALRYYAMGPSSIESDARPDATELATMARLLAEGIDAGALGFSSSRTLRHKVPDGRHVPGTFAETDELQAMADVLGAAGRGVIECAPRFDGDGPSEPRARSEMEWMRAISARTRRPVTFNLTHTWANPDHHRLIGELVRTANADGATIRPQTTSRGIGVLFCFDSATPFDRHQAWRDLRVLSRAERLAAIRTPSVRDRLVEAAAGGPNPDELALFHLTEGPVARYDCAPGSSLPDLATTADTSMAEVYLDALDRTDGDAIVYWPILNQSFDAISEMLLDDSIVLGLADAGAHVGQILDASQPTWFLSYWVRERALMPIERAVQRLSADGAQLFGLRDRGVIRPGAFADLNVIDLDALALPLPRFVHDFPRGAGRFVQGASGYDVTVVNGAVFMESGEHTGELAGTVLRGGT